MADLLTSSERPSRSRGTGRAPRWLFVAVPGVVVAASAIGFWLWRAGGHTRAVNAYCAAVVAGDREGIHAVTTASPVSTGLFSLAQALRPPINVDGFTATSFAATGAGGQASVEWRLAVGTRAQAKIAVTSSVALTRRGLAWKIDDAASGESFRKAVAEGCLKWAAANADTDRRKVAREVWAGVASHLGTPYDEQAANALSADYLASARELADAANFGQAVTEYRALLRDFPASEEAGVVQERGLLADSLYRWGQVLAEQNQPAEALQAYDSLIRDFPDSEQAAAAKSSGQLASCLLKKARADTFVQSWAQAEAAFNRVISQFPDTQYEAQARLGLLDIEVAKAGVQPHLPLPPLVEEGPPPREGEARLTVRNATSYSLRIVLSGPEVAKLNLAPGQEGALRVKAGNYRAAAWSQGGGTPFYAARTLEPSAYSLTISSE